MKPPVTMIASASPIHHDIGPHQKSSGSARPRPRMRKQTTSPMFDGLKTCSPFHLITCFESSEPPATATYSHQSRKLHQAPCGMSGMRSTNATPLPVRSALAGHMITRFVRNVIAISSTAQVPSDTRICAIESRKLNATCPSTCSDVIVAARWRRGSFSFGKTTGYVVPRIATAVIRHQCSLEPCAWPEPRAIVDDVVENARGPVSVFVADVHGELVAAASMDGAAPDTRLNAQRKAYTAARSDARSTRESPRR